jgi:Short C-terminal domain
MTRVVLAAMLLIATPAVAKESASPPAEPSTHPEWTKIRDQGLSTVTSGFFDPGSAVINWTSGFQWGYYKPIIGRRTYAWVACGTINAKNRLGGYVGASPFFIAADASGSAFGHMGYDYVSTCTAAGSSSVPVNAELKNISPNMPVTSGTVASVADELAKLAGLRDRGIITQAEFEDQKARLLAR